MSSPARHPGTSTEQPALSRGDTDFHGGRSGERQLPAPEDYPQAPQMDAATIRVHRIATSERRIPFYAGRAFVEGIAIGQVNASSRQAALAGAVAIIEARWQKEEAEEKKETAEEE